jgi:sugar-specific transcriptional regulator TrmB
LEGHKSHECVPLKDKIDELSQEVRTMMTTLQREKEKVKENAIALNNNIEHVEKAYQSTLKEIVSIFNQLREAVDKREQEIKITLNKTKEEIGNSFTY